jgi:hypothetical protein
MPESRGGRLDYAYYFLGVFELITVAGALYLAHQMTSMFDRAVDANRAWQQRVRVYAALDHAVADVRRSMRPSPQSNGSRRPRGRKPRRRSRPTRERSSRRIWIRSIGRG